MIGFLFFLTLDLLNLFLQMSEQNTLLSLNKPFSILPHTLQVTVLSTLGLDGLYLDFHLEKFLFAMAQSSQVLLLRCSTSICLKQPWQARLWIRRLNSKSPLDDNHNLDKFWGGGFYPPTLFVLMLRDSYGYKKLE